MTSLSEIVRERLGWCPRCPAAQAAQPKIGNGIIAVAIICLILLSAAALMIPARAPENVAVWAFKIDDSGVKYFAGRLPATEDTNGNLVFSAAGAASPALSPGNYALLIEHPGKDGSFLLVLDGANVKLRLPDPAGNSMMLFTISGPGSLQQEDAYKALVAAFDPGNSGGSGAGTSGYVTEREYRAGS